MLSQSRAIFVLVLLMCAAGLYSLTVIPSGLFPDTDFPRIVIIVDNGVMPADQMAATVTRPVEEALSGVLDVERITSSTSRGSCELNVFFSWKADMVLSLELVQARLALVHLPPTAHVRRLERLTFAVFPVAGYSFTSSTMAPDRLRELVQYEIKPRLARLPGVADVALAGGKVREFHLVLEPARLAARGVSATQVVDAVRSFHAVSSPGLLEENHQLEMVLVSGLVQDPAQLLQIGVTFGKGEPVRVGDVARLAPGVAPDYTLVTADGHDAVLLNVLRQPNGNILEVTDAVKAELARVPLPAGVQVAPFYDESLLVRSSMQSVTEAMVLGLALSALILWAFLRNVAITLVAVVVIPITLLAAVLAMHLLGLSFNLMTLGGMTAAVGLVIDDAIVMVENIQTHGSVRQALKEITAPLIGSTLTPVVVFLPLLLLGGITGVFFRSLATTLTVALLTSLFLALFFTPVLAQAVVRPGRHAAHPVPWYGALLRLVLRHPVWVGLVCLSCVVGAVRLYAQLPSEFLPAFDEGAFVLDYEAEPGSSLAETDRMLRQIESYLKDTPEIESYSRRTGLQLGMALTEPNIGDFLVKLKAQRSRSTVAVMDELRSQITTHVPGLQTEFLGILVDLVGDLTGAHAPIEIRVFCEDTALLHATARHIEETIAGIPGIVDTNAGMVVSGGAVVFQLDPERAARLGVTMPEVQLSLNTALQGDLATSLLQGDRPVGVRVVYPPVKLPELENLLLRSSSGSVLRLGQAADVRFESGLSQISRDGLRQCLTVSAHLDGVDLGTAMARIQEAVKPVRGVHLEFAGLYEQQQASFRELLMVLTLAGMLIFFTLLVEFRSFAEPVAIVFSALMSLVGVLLGLWAGGQTLNVISLMGAIMVMGIVAKNGILMLDAVGDGPLEEALVRAGQRRLRPILMTSLAAILGMVPMAGMLRPLSVGVIGGLAFSLPFSLLVTPSVFAWWRGR